MTQVRTNASAMKVLKVFKALRGHTLHGLSNGELASGLRESPSTVTRALHTLIAEGLVQKLDSGRYAHSVQTLQIAQAHANEMATATNRIAEINARVAAGAGK